MSETTLFSKSVMELYKIPAWSFLKFESNEILILILTRPQFQEKACIHKHWIQQRT